MVAVQYLGLVLLAAWAAGVWAFLIVLDARPGHARAALWGAVLLVPIAGFVAWYLVGPRPAKT